MKEIGTNFDQSLVSGVGGSKKAEQKDSNQGDYSFGDALSDKQTEQDKVEKKEMEHQEIDRNESKDEIDKKEYEKFLQRQNLLLNNNNITGMASTQQMAHNLPNQVLSAKVDVKSASPAGNQLQNQGQVGLRDLQKLMTQRGISFSQLNAQQMSKLSSVHSRAEVTGFLNELVKEMRSDDNDKNLLSTGAHHLLGDKSERKGEKVTQVEKKKKLGDKPEDDVEKMQEISGASEQLDKLQGAPLSQFFESAKLSDFKQGSAMEQQIMKQVMDKMEINTEHAKSEVAIKLNPEYLGEVRLNMVVDKDKGTVSVNFKTTSRTAKKTLEGNSSNLKEAFAAAGLKMDKFEVSLEDELT